MDPSNRRGRRYHATRTYRDPPHTPQHRLFNTCRSDGEYPYGCGRGCATLNGCKRGRHEHSRKKGGRYQRQRTSQRGRRERGRGEASSDFSAYGRQILLVVIPSVFYYTYICIYVPASQKKSSLRDSKARRTSNAQKKKPAMVAPRGLSFAGYLVRTIALPTTNRLPRTLITCSHVTLNITISNARYSRGQSAISQQQPTYRVV